VIQSLRNAGHEVLRLKDYLPIESSDLVVIAKAQELDTLLLSLNGDFSDIVTYPPENYQGIIALQVRNHPETIPRLLMRLQTYFSLFPVMEHYVGKLLIVEAHRIRTR
jgi:hypothetical protein